MSNLGSNAATPLHKLDVVQVVLHPSKIAEAKGDKGHVSSPVEVFLLFNNLQSMSRLKLERLSACTS